MKQQFSSRSLIAMALMALSASLTVIAAPGVMLADSRGPVKLEVVVPESFGEWRLDRSMSNMLVEPALQRAIDAVYAQTISRVYVNTHGERIMLAIAYGRDQSDTFQVHLPEGCYEGQGFAVRESFQAALATQFGVIPVRRMVAERADRREAVTYWIVVGEDFGTDEWQRKKVKLSYALDRIVPDGMLVRVSSITGETKAAYESQQRFIEAMLTAVPHQHRKLLLGEKFL